MKRMVLLLTLVWLGLFGMGTVAQAMEVTKFPISTIKNKIEASPDIYGDIVVWQGEGDGNYLNIYGKNLTTGQTFDVCSGSYPQQSPSIYDDLVVWQETSTTYPWNIYGKYLSGGDPFLIASNHAGSSNQNANPQVWGSVVVWQDYRNGTPDIYGIDLSHTINGGLEFPIANGTPEQTNPKIYGDIVVWESDNDTTSIKSSVYGKNIVTDQFYTIAMGTDDIACADPDIYGNTVAWVEKTSGRDYLYTKDLDTNGVILWYEGGKPTYPDLSEDLLVWKQQGQPHGSIYAKDLEHPEEGFTIIALPDDYGYTDTFGPAAFGNTMVWSYSTLSNYDADIYGATVVPLPATFWLLGSGLGLLAVGRRHWLSRSKD